MGGWFSSLPEVDMEGDKAKEVQSLIDENVIVIFSKSYCPYCTMATKVFDEIKAKYSLIQLDHRDDGNVIQAILGKLTGASTVPRVFVKGTCIGGGTDVKKLHEERKLLPMIS